MSKKIGYSKTFPHLVNGTWEKIWIEEEVPDETDTRQTLYGLKKQVTDFFFESNKADEKKAEVKVERPKDIEQGIIFDINNCNDAAVLQKTYHLLARNNQAVGEAYENQLKKLTNE